MTKQYIIKVGEVFTQKKADELIEYLEMKDEEIIQRLDRVEERLKLSGGSMPNNISMSNQCIHEWDIMEGASDFPTYKCVKCGKIEGRPIISGTA